MAEDNGGQIGEVDQAAEAEAMLCPHCLTEIAEGASFCRECGAPVGAMSGIGPFERTLAVGHVMREGMRLADRQVVFWGLLAILLPQALVFSGFAVAAATQSWSESHVGHHESWVGALGMTVAAVVYSLAIAKLIHRRMSHGREIEFQTKTQE